MSGNGRRGDLKPVAYYTGCLAALSAKELDTSTRALAPKVGLELSWRSTPSRAAVRATSTKAEPDYYLHLNARILAYAEDTGSDARCSRSATSARSNLRQANFQLQNDEALRDRINRNLLAVGVPAYSGGVEVRHLLWMVAEGEGYERMKQSAHKGLKGLKIALLRRQILRPSKLLGFEDPPTARGRSRRSASVFGGEVVDYPAR